MKNQMKNHSSRNGLSGEDKKINSSAGTDEIEKTRKEEKEEDTGKNKAKEDEGPAADKKPPGESGAGTRPAGKTRGDQNAEAGVDSADQKDKDTGLAGDDKEDMLKYFEKKFEIKE